ncbi:OmpA family protein [Frigidibacter sp. ROC022]|uniref:OmpA family protein n=1 Tax=Frigidibacter sp. ROC022 TaxID=2971796 RepID=UPI00215B71B7|nr:OmpA family protein [Frigidibacter sp. ROC022]MCR8723316.1 OmpA family protein [Frigidibacter sp. ROC022]
MTEATFRRDHGTVRLLSHRAGWPRRALRWISRLAVPAAFGLGLVASPAAAQDDPFEDGWVLRDDSSTLSFQSVKNQTKVETSGFATFSGGIDENGLATIKILMDSVDTKVDLRNVRMRFLFFETFQYPEATVQVQLNEADLLDLPDTRRKTMTLPFTLTLHGVTKELSADVAVVLISSDLVAVSTVSPISISVDDFNLSEGLEKLKDAAKVEIVPSGAVTFDFLFARNKEDGDIVTAGIAEDDDDDDEIEDTSDDIGSVALETKGDFGVEECVGRFEILSRTRSINFAVASARLSADSNAFLDALYDIVRRCPGMVIEIGGHTDSDGSDATNQALSERRAAAVAAYLEAKGISGGRLVTKGYGESQPLVANNSSRNKAKNRRIEFKVLSNG